MVLSFSIAFAVLLAMYLKVFFYQRTIRKVHMRTGIGVKSLDVMYPPAYLTMHAVSMLRWAIIIALFFFNWIVALVCLIANFLLPAILPEQDDYKNIQTARSVIKKRAASGKEDVSYLSSLDVMLKSIMDEMDK